MTYDELAKELISLKEKERLDYKDYEKLKKLLSCIKLEKTVYDENWKILYEKYKDLYSNLKERLFRKYNKDNMFYIVANSYLLPLVLTNNTQDIVKIRGDNGYMFRCFSHYDKNPSMIVQDYSNISFCFSCREVNGSLTYIEKYESISYTDAVELLSDIFLISKEITNPELKSLSEKYRNTITSQEYLDLINEGYERLKLRNKDVLFDKIVDDEYQKRLDLIKRINNHEYDPNFEYKEYDPKLLLKK